MDRINARINGERRQISGRISANLTSRENGEAERRPFGKRLINKARECPSCQVIICDEAYTYVTCGLLHEDHLGRAAESSGQQDLCVPFLWPGSPWRMPCSQVEMQDICGL